MNIAAILTQSIQAFPEGNLIEDELSPQWNAQAAERYVEAYVGGRLKTAKETWYKFLISDGTSAIEKLTKEKCVWGGKCIQYKVPCNDWRWSGFIYIFFFSVFSKSTQLCEISDAINSIGLVTCGTDSDINVPLSDYGDSEVNNGY